MTRKSSPMKVISSTLRIVKLSSTASRVLGTMGSWNGRRATRGKSRKVSDCADGAPLVSSKGSYGGKGAISKGSARSRGKRARRGSPRALGYDLGKGAQV